MAETQTATSNLGTGTDIASREASLTKAVIKNVDMSDEMVKETVDIAVAALQEHPIEKDIAAKIKRDMDKKFNPTWHVVVGKNFGSFVTHGMFIVWGFAFPDTLLNRTSLIETKHFIYFYIDKMAFLVWRS